MREALDDTAPPTDAELAALFASGSLAAAIAQGFGLETHADAVVVEDRCLALHADGAIDLLTLGDDGFEGIAPHDFFTLQHFLNRALPQLSSDPDRVMGLVEALVAAGGDDMASNAPNGALVEWCRADPARGRAVVDAAWAGDARAGAHLTFALQALGAIEEARRFVIDLDDPRRLGGMTALGRIPDPDPNSREASLRALQKGLGNRTDDDRLVTHVVEAASALAEQDGGPSPLAAETLRRALAQPGDQARNRVAMVIWAHPTVVSDETLDLFLPVLAGVNADHAGTLREVDLAVHHLLGGPFWARGLELLSTLVARSERPIDIGVFKSATRALCAGPSHILSRAVCAWLLSGKSRLCAAIAQALNGIERGDRPLDLAPGDLPVEDEALVFLCRKIAGWLFLMPRLASEAFISVLAACAPTAAPAVEAHLSGLLLRNYGGLHTRLEALDPVHPAKARVAAAVADNATYLAGLDGVPRLKELQPSASRRRIALQHQADAMRQAQVAAEAESVLLQLVKRQTVLHGVRTLSFVEDPSGQTHPFRMDLHSHSVEVEFPRMQVGDAVGLQILLRTLRLEGLTE